MNSNSINDEIHPLPTIDPPPINLPFIHRYFTMNLTHRLTNPNFTIHQRSTPPPTMTPPWQAHHDFTRTAEGAIRDSHGPAPDPGASLVACGAGPEGYGGWWVVNVSPRDEDFIGGNSQANTGTVP